MMARISEHICPVAALQNVIAGKWKVIILCYLTKKTLRFGELQKSIPKISVGILTQQLRELEEDGLIDREIYKEVPPRVEYSLTDLGKSLVPIINVMNEWGQNYINQKLKSLKS